MTGTGVTPLHHHGLTPLKMHPEAVAGIHKACKRYSARRVSVEVCDTVDCRTPQLTQGTHKGGRKPLREVKAAELSGDVTRCKDHAVLLPLQHRAAHGCINNADSCFMSGLCNAVKQSYD